MLNNMQKNKIMNGAHTLDENKESKTQGVELYKEKKLSLGTSFLYSYFYVFLKEEKLCVDINIIKKFFFSSAAASFALLFYSFITALQNNLFSLHFIMLILIKRERKKRKRTMKKKKT